MQYNLKGKQLKRKIEISKLKGINKNIIIYIIEKIYEHLIRKNLLFQIR